MNNKNLTGQEIAARIDELENSLFYLQMSDFMDWDAYYSIRNELDSLKKLQEVK